jgi:hypothetical protein
MTQYSCGANIMPAAQLTYNELRKDIISFLKGKYPPLNITVTTKLGTGGFYYTAGQVEQIVGEIKARPFFPNKPKITIYMRDVQALLNGKNATVGGLVDLFAGKLGIKIPKKKPNP